MSDVRPPSFPAQCVWLAPHPWRRPSQDKTFCCDPMRKAVVDFCDQHDNPWECNYATLVYNEPLDEFGIVLRDRDPEYVLIRHCPWCGSGLPVSRREEWFDALEARGFQDVLGLDASELPAEFLTGAWRREGKL